MLLCVAELPTANIVIHDAEHDEVRGIERDIVELPADNREARRDGIIMTSRRRTVVGPNPRCFEDVLGHGKNSLARTRL